MTPVNDPVIINSIDDIVINEDGVADIIVSFIDVDQDLVFIQAYVPDIDEDQWMVDLNIFEHTLTVAPWANFNGVVPIVVGINSYDSYDKILSLNYIIMQSL